MEIFYFADSKRYPDDVVTELQDQMNCNQDSENGQDWFDHEDWPDHISIVSEAELIQHELDNPL